MFQRVWKKQLVYGIIAMFFGLNVLSNFTVSSEAILDSNTCVIDQNNTRIHEKSSLDIHFIYNITANLSQLIFSEYDEEHGEIAKGRYFGSKGEHRAAEILKDNMSKLGLWTTVEKIENIPNMSRNKNLYETLTHDVEILEYELKIDNETIDCYIAPSWKGPREHPEQLDFNFSYAGLNVKPKPTSFGEYLCAFIEDKENENYVFIEEEQFRNPKTTCKQLNVIFPYFFHPYRLPLFYSRALKSKLDFHVLYHCCSHCQGLLIYDYNNDTHNMVYSKETTLPVIYINGTTGRKIMTNLENTTIDFYLNQRYNQSRVSYNVIGQLNGTDPNTTVIIDCLYDGMWCQATADSAIGMAMVLGIAKYFIDYNITPACTLKFIGFGGEETGLRGAYYYEATHKEENIRYILDLNQLGFIQTNPKLTLFFYGNNLPFLMEMWKIARHTPYEQLVNHTADMRPIWQPLGAPSDENAFISLDRNNCKCICFLKCYPWLLHHRDGLHHQEGDTLKYFDWDDVKATGQILQDIIRYLVVS